MSNEKKLVNRNVLTAMGFEIPVKVFDNTDYLNASEMAKYRPEGKPSVEKYSVKNLIRDFLSHKATYEYILEWEYMHNPTFNIECELHDDGLDFKGGKSPPLAN